jgi:hypothetical protein
MRNKGQRRPTGSEGRSGTERERELSMLASISLRKAQRNQTRSNNNNKYASKKLMIKKVIKRGKVRPKARPKRERKFYRE